MAEAAVNFVLGKLGEIIVKEGKLLGGVGEQVKWAQRELTNIRCYLSDADSRRRKGDARAENWLNQLRDVAYRIEDAIDIFFVEVEDNRQKDHQKGPSFKEKLKRMWHKPKELHKLAIELGDVKKVLDEIIKSRIDYGIEPLQEQDIDGRDTRMVPSRRATYQGVDETEVVGLDADRNKILELLSDEKIRRRAVITIVGAGGIGKTTLAHMVYKSAMKDFEYHIMLSVSQQFSQTDLLLKMLKKFDSIVPDNTDVGELIMELKDKLGRSKYLIILDDVWEVNLWNQLKNALPDNKNGSRVLMTSRFIDVAKSADPGMPPYELDFLNDKESRDLLLKKAFFYQELDEEYPSDLLEIADELSKKCKGLPLALIVLGGILSTKDHTHSAWERVLRTMDWQSDGRGCMDVLAMSYDDMPYYLKTCFLYLASFPEDYKISSKRLIKMWIAEGFIPHEGRKSMEEIAEDCLEKLFQRCMIQVSSRHLNGLIKKCRVHDLLRDLAMYQAGKDNFITVLPNPEDINYPDTTTRRASFQSCHPQLIKYVGPNTRSLLYFFPKDVPKYNEFRLLKVLEVVSVDIPVKKSLTGLEKLIHLKYLGFRKCNSNLTIPVDSLGCLKNLETLDLRGISTEGTIPSNLWEIDTLRHVLFDKHDHVVLPPNAYLRNLQTIKWVDLAVKPWPVNKIPCLTNLRRLSLKAFSHWDNTIHLLGTLPHLISLKITAYMEILPNEIVYPRMLPNYQNLQTLFLEGRWPESVTLEASLFPPHLIKLTLSLSFLFHDPMEELGKLTSLKELRLRDYVYLGKKMICSAGFPNLERLEVEFEEPKVFSVAKGVMSKLKYLDKSYDLILELPPELMHLDKDNGLNTDLIRDLRDLDSISRINILFSEVMSSRSN